VVSLLLVWTYPIGIGVFLVCLGIFIWLLAKADEVKKRVKGKDKE
jgi:uncharacterized membrane protein